MREIGGSRELRSVSLLLVALVCFGCGRQKSPVEASAATPAFVTASASESTAVAFAADSTPLPSINGARAFQFTKEIIAIGPRPIGSNNHRKLEEYIINHLKGETVENDSFFAETPEGKLPVRNIIAKFPGTKDGIIVIAGHYDTPYYLRNTGFVGANDGGSSTAMLLELANQLRSKKRDGYSVWLLFTDGEEAVRQWTATDSVYGTRHISEAWQKDGTLTKIKAFLLQDMIGDADLDVQRDENSTPWLEDVVNEAATRYGYQSHFFQHTSSDLDDHIPFGEKGVPVADLIDLNYGYGNSFWHTPQDTIDKVSAKSLQIAGDVILETVRLLDALPTLPPPSAKKQ